uniref:C protein n=1 Tax=Raton olivaceo morbillivirus TaxID=2928189 RepID=A0A9N6YJJ7_9MONO|nr:TPA_asm: C protein [Raton olivaceo morbillivirus]
MLSMFSKLLRQGRNHLRRRSKSPPSFKSAENQPKGKRSRKPSQSFHHSQLGTMSQMNLQSRVRLHQIIRGLKKRVQLELDLIQPMTDQEEGEYCHLQFLMTMLNRLQMGLTLNLTWAALVTQDICTTERERSQFNQALNLLKEMIPPDLWQIVTGTLEMTS